MDNNEKTPQEIIAGAAKTAKGLSIAVIVLAALGLVGSLITLGITGILAQNSDEFVDGIKSSLNISLDNGTVSQSSNLSVNSMFTTAPGPSGTAEMTDEEFEEFLDSALSDENVEGAVDLILGLIRVVVIIGIIVSLFSIIVAVITIKQTADPKTLKSAKGLNIAGAIINFLAGQVIVMILMIIAAVQCHKIRKTQDELYVSTGNVIIEG